MVHVLTEEDSMAWFKRWRNKMRNYTSGGDYAGSHGSGSSGPSAAATKARFGHDVTRLRDTTGPNG
ncbi:MAG: hypothetical protein WBP59_02010 [Ilumatobacteraceae bacterium]